MNPWDDLEQRFLRYSTTVKEMVKAMSAIADSPQVSAEIVDSVANTANGLLEFIEVNESMFADDIEAKIVNDYKLQGYQQTYWTTEIDQNNMITLPKVVCQVLNWKPGDLLQWEIKDGKTVMVRMVRKLGN